ncbi:MAG: hypothetical protein J6331_07750, partial [Lentisphaeria bacterium]|nr:hypothetical protein [Lentisphaeria bacterium]
MAGERETTRSFSSCPRRIGERRNRERNSSFAKEGKRDFAVLMRNIPFRIPRKVRSYVEKTESAGIFPRLFRKNERSCAFKLGIVVFLLQKAQSLSAVFGGRLLDPGLLDAFHVTVHHAAGGALAVAEVDGPRGNEAVVDDASSSLGSTGEIHRLIFRAVEVGAVGGDEDIAGPFDEADLESRPGQRPAAVIEFRPQKLVVA